jgi:hypothetical protein
MTGAASSCFFKTILFEIQFEEGRMMTTKSLSCLAAGMILAVAAAPAQAQVAISVGTPGVYGAIDVGNAPAPALVYQQPVAIETVPVGVAPMYLYVPPAQYAAWGSYCAQYNACDRQVYFVSRDWYSRRYVPYYNAHRSYYEGRRGAFERMHGGRGFAERRGLAGRGGPRGLADRRGPGGRGFAERGAPGHGGLAGGHIENHGGLANHGGIANHAAPGHVGGIANHAAPAHTSAPHVGGGGHGGGGHHK